MRFFTTVAAGMLAAVAGAKDLEGPFYLTFVPNDGDEYAATIGEASRGVSILSSWDKYDQQYVYDSESKRIAPKANPKFFNAYIDAKQGPVIFDGQEYDNAQLDQVEVDGAVYLVKFGVDASGAAGWQSQPAQGDLYKNVYWYGADNGKANSKLRIDTKKPQK